MDTSNSPQRPAPEPTRGPWLLAVAGVVLFPGVWLAQGNETGYWLPGLGLGMTLVAWLGWRVLPLLGAGLACAYWAVHRDLGAPVLLINIAIHAAEIGLAWWLYHHLAHGSRWLDDPRSATLFLILVPGFLAAVAAVLEASARVLLTDAPMFAVLAAQLWLSRMVGILVVAPLLIITCTPILLRYRLADIELPPAFFGERDSGMANVGAFGEGIELAGLTIAVTVLSLLLLWTHVVNNDARWVLWASCLVLIVWTCVRQGLQGGCFTACMASAAVVLAAQAVRLPEDMRAAVQSGVQGSVLGFCSTALLVGTSASWIRASETRFRHVVGRIPFVVYSARLPYGIPVITANEPQAKKGSKPDIHIGPSISKLANVLLVSPACRQVLSAEPEALLGPFERWLDSILEEDRVLLIAALAQLCMQKQPVTCEFRLRSAGQADAQTGPARFGAASAHRWLRDTLTPHYSEDNLLDGWDGLIEDITDQRNLSNNLRKTTAMLQVLVANLPTGVFFVQAPSGYPLLVNARARQLLGQREDLSAGLPSLSKTYRLHRPDGAEYDWQELPVSKAIRQGVACRANDIIVHRADGRKTPLISWAAPIDLNNTGKFDAAVWVLEDLTALQQAEIALRESETRLRAIIETMGEGVIVQDGAGVILDCNAAACAILGGRRDRLIGQGSLAADSACVREDGTALARDEHPDRVALRTQQPARGVQLGLPTAGGVRWLLVNAMPVPLGAPAGPRRGRVVTTFADITEHVQAQDSLRLTRDKYQNLVETLPFMLLQRDAQFNITYLNPAATQLTGHSAEEMMQPEFCEKILHPDDFPSYYAAAETIAQGKSTRIEARFRAKDGSWKSVLAFFHPNLHHGQVVGSTSLVVDMTMQRRLEEELRHAQHLELISKLASGIVHDFNHWLTVMVGFAGVAKRELPPAHPAQAQLARIEDAGEQAAHLAGQLLTFSKQRPRQARPVDLNLVIEQTLKLIKSAMPANVALVRDLTDGLPMVLGDESQLKQVLMNLCLNARDAMPDGGTLTVRTDDSLPSSDAAKCWVHLVIQDTGAGMAEDVQARVFEPFFSTKEHGTGLGLAVVQQIIKDSGGIIDVWSKQGEGTRFDIWLPVALLA